MDRFDKNFRNAKDILDTVERTIKPAVDGYEPGQPMEWWESFDGQLKRHQDITDGRYELVKLVLGGISDCDSPYAARSLAEQAIEQKLPQGNLATVIFSLCKTSLAKHAIEEGKTDEALQLLTDIQEFGARNGKVTDEKLLELIRAFAEAHKDQI